MIIQPIVNIAEICVQHDITQAIICPGSRSAPLTLAFARHPKIKTFVIPDERSAGFIGMGLAQSSKKPVAIICTSGTAAANLYPAVIEAYYQQVPLLIFTADRPPEWIDQQDGQTIRQQNLFQNHILASYQFPVSFVHEESVWHSEKMISEAILKTSGSSAGPVHINVPIREPFYPAADEKYHYSDHIKVIKSVEAEWDPGDKWAIELIEELKKYNKILVVAGQTRVSPELGNHLNRIQKKLKWVILGDITSNISSLEHPITKHDIILEDEEEVRSLKADLLITFGQGVISKSLKYFLRNEKAKVHWHVDLSNVIIDPFKSLTKKILLEPYKFFKLIDAQLSETDKIQNAFSNYWIEKELQSRTFIDDFFETKYFSEFHAAQIILSKLPEHGHLHLANSMPVRYANYLGLDKNHKNTIWSNRGTSGIDGGLSTAVGHSINTNSLNVIITGDMAFFYDRNGLWHNHVPDNLRIIILNNHGGGIFRLINGPNQLDELEEFFETNQKLKASNTARDFGMKYFTVKSIDALPGFLEQFFDGKAGPSILEIETDSKINQQVFENFKQKSTRLWN